MLDLTDAGARIEHFARLDIGRESRFRFPWQGRPIEVNARVMACRVHRFVPGDSGATVYQSGLSFTEIQEEAANALREIVATLVSRSLAEQVANARGIGPVTQSTMPVFMEGDVVTASLDGVGEKGRRLIPENEIVLHRGYLRCTLTRGRWEKKWTHRPEQPENGFTVLATEPLDHVETLCHEYFTANEDNRNLIRLLAQASVESTEDTPEPV